MTADMMKWLGVILAGAAWFALVVLGKSDADQFVQFLMLGITGLGAHGATKAAGTAAAAAAIPATPEVVTTRATGLPGQGGRIMWGLITLIAAFAILAALSACAGIPQPLVAVAKASHDNEIENMKLLVCDLPYAAILRHQEIIPAVKSLCDPPASTGAVLSAPTGK